MERFLKPVFGKLVSATDKKNPNLGRFTLEKLERGYGNTLGTSLRRTLLSSVPGASVFAVEIKGVAHEFQAISNVREDAVEIILNTKEMIIEADTSIINPDEIYEFKLSSKVGEITFQDIEVPEGFKIINNDFIFAHTFKNNALEVIFYVNYSKGYKTFEENRIFIREKLGNKQNLISIDSNYSPITKVSYLFEEVNPGETKVYERLKLEVETKGNVLPEKAVAYAAAVLGNYLQVFNDLQEINIDEHFEDEKEEVEKDTQLTMTIDSLNLSVRSENALKAAGIITVDQLIDRPVSSLQGIKNLGDKSKTEIIQVVQDLGLSFKSE